MGWLHKYKTNLRKAQRYGLFKTYIGKAEFATEIQKYGKVSKGSPNNISRNHLLVLSGL